VIFEYFVPGAGGRRPASRIDAPLLRFTDKIGVESRLVAPAAIDPAAPAPCAR
jgi:hypothetical protein